MGAMRLKECLAVLFVLLYCPTIFGAEPESGLLHWAQWRGPSGQGIAKDSRVPLAWSPTENLLWKTKLPGVGNSTPIIWGDRIFLTSADKAGKERYVLCLRTSDGKILWKQLAAEDPDPGPTNEWNGYATPSCATDGKHVYAFFGTPGLFCYDLDGKLVWKHVFGKFVLQTGWGIAASPFLYEDLVIQNCDHDGPQGLSAGANTEGLAPVSLVALDKKTGGVRWQVERNQGKGWSTPVLVPSPNGQADLVLNGSFGIWAHEPLTGKERWRCERHKGDTQAMFGEPMPAFTKDMIYSVSGRPGPMQGLRLGGAGDLTKTNVVWDITRKGSRDIGSPVLVGDHLYLADWQGRVSCYDRKTGKQMYFERLSSRNIFASPIVLAGKLLFLIENGETVVMEPGPAFKVIHRNKLEDESVFRASPAVADGKLFLRSQSHLYCIGENKGK